MNSTAYSKDVPVWTQYRGRINKGEKLHWTLIDPDEQTPYNAGTMAELAEEAGTDGILVGGSTGVSQTSLYNTIHVIKSRSNLPVIIFPGSGLISKEADAILFSSLLNSKIKESIEDMQRKATLEIYDAKLEVIPTGYLIVEPGMKAGEIGEADLIGRYDMDTAIEYSLRAQYKGKKLVYLEAGSGAPEPMPKEMVKKVKEYIEIPLAIGGGINTPEIAKELTRAGADIIVNGTIVETSNNIRLDLEKIIRAIKSC